MKQAIILEASDLAVLKRGEPLIVHVGDSAIELIYKDSNHSAMWTCPQCDKTIPVASKGGHARAHQRYDNMWTCPKCQKIMKQQGRGAHNRMHERNKK